LTGRQWLEKPANHSEWSACTVADALREMAESWLHALEQDTRWWAIGEAALRLSDRSSLLPLLKPGRGEGHHWTKWLVKSARLAYSFDLKDPGPGELAAREIEEAAKPRTWWQVSYNAACARARLSGRESGTANREAAFRLLDQSRRRKGA
jgi:hypothetical protein